jgi:hypothetical protein
MRFDVWLIDSVTAIMTLIEKDLAEGDALEWWNEWNKNHRNCVCVLAPSDVEIPESFKTINTNRIRERL